MTGPVRIKSGVRAPSAPDPGWRERIAAEELADLVAAGRRFAPDLTRGSNAPSAQRSPLTNAEEMHRGRIGASRLRCSHCGRALGFLDFLTVAMVLAYGIVLGVLAMVTWGPR